MSDDTRQRIHYHLTQLDNLDAARRLFAELNYDITRELLPRAGWSQTAYEALAEDPQLIATHDDFHIIYGRLPGEGPRQLEQERYAINQLLKEHPYALFLFSDNSQQHWHFVNVKYERNRSDETESATRRILRRITVGPYERQHGRLRTAADRLALLDLQTIDPNLFGIWPLAIQQRHDEAFDVERVTRDFFKDYRQMFEYAEANIIGLDEEEQLRLFTQRLFNRLMFVIFLERKGWLRFGDRDDYLRALWQDHLQQHNEDPDVNFFQHRLKLLFFSGLNAHNEVNANTGIVDKAGDPLRTVLHDYIGEVPYLNGGLFEEDDLDRAEVEVPDTIFRRALNEIFYHYNFTVTESTPLDVEVAVDPEMLGKIFEELVTGRHESGSYYTPKPIVSFMGREALKGYLETECSHETVEALTKFVDERDARNLRDPESVLEALRTITICDPACGSGAYLVGMLHELLELRHALFTARNLDAVTIYERKLEIIQNNLYGVDIDPFAVNIARLRLWLSLVVDYEGNKPEPLPNLDFKIEVGDSLTAPDPSGGLQPDLFRHQQVRDYFDLKSEYMAAHGERKRDLKRQIDELRARIAEWAHPEEKSSASGEGKSFDWVVEFAEVFANVDSKGAGFDIIIANPPYVRQTLLSQGYKRRLNDIYSTVYSGYADLYVYFYKRGFQLMRPHGMLVFISSNKFMRSGYGKRLRRFLSRNTTLHYLIDFGDLPVFEAAAYPAIVVSEKQKAGLGNNVRVLSVDSLSTVQQLTESVCQAGWDLGQELFTESNWSLVKPEVIELLEKLKRGKTTFAEYVGDNFYRGVVTGYNEAFVIDQRTKDYLVKKDSSSSEIIHQWLRGRDVKRWSTEWDGKYVIFTRRGIDINRYPAVRDYLLQYKAKLMPRPEEWPQGMPWPGRKSGPYEWYEIQDSTAFYPEFAKPKIISTDIAKRSEFTLDESGSFIDATLFCIPMADRYLLGLLNSAVVEFYYRMVSSTIRGDYLRFKKIYLSTVPLVKEPPAEVRAQIEHLVDELLRCKEDTEIIRLESALAQLVFKLYGLSNDEVELIKATLA